ncbi:NH(3)-dependent NAD(+) synthetase [Desulfobulbus propionicus DSM 2032]|uniref:Glutamine-dependent NAD(+) synthetase n=1 Tax=Desulfobulbus propionicus (strain ATCC 33891 / DSM 2032 / VKM B-1956 / 1pr3) TaxID=577650 RepID=A0A7U4DNH7_DESPD|nr:NAD+ synthase [Desulfobulbus propionicus]ADW17034.1 NH(3)-dependent NAD(+) synthetase [Desulfobulbus propionicus DSM 2032]
MKIALIQTNPIIGAFERNLRQVLHWIGKARQARCDLVVFPELTLCGYPPQDLLERPAFLDGHDRALVDLVKQLAGISCIVGVPERRQGPGKPLYNSAYVLERDKIAVRARKQLLPTYDVFDETRYFEPGTTSTVFPCKGVHCGLTICEDIWWNSEIYPTDPLKDLVIGPIVPDCLINISASPYHYGKLEERQQVFTRLCRDNNLPLLYVNQVGGQDGLIFDGHSMVMTPRGTLRAVAAGFGEDMLVVDSEDWDRDGGQLPADSVADVEQALVLGVRDYLHKTGFRRAVLGLSGGIDSAVTAVIACRALGPENVLCVAMPSPYTSQASIDDARQLAANLGCDFEIIAISALMETYRASLAPLFTGLAEDATEQNIQARIRGNLLMALSNKFKRLLLTTGNKSEMAVGYCTLYGDMSGGLAVIADVPKIMVYELAHLLNRERELIPERIITRPPTAELKPDQCDQDDLPPYEVLDGVLKAYLEEHKSIEAIVANGYDAQMVRDIVRRIKLNEYKRKQAPLGIKVTTKAFGPGRRYPLVQGFVE